MPRTKKKKKPARSGGRRAGWRGMLRFGLVTFPVEAYNAHLRDEGAVSFHQLHAECGRRIHYEKVCPVHGTVNNDEIVSGYEYAKGNYVEIDPDELDEFRTERERALTLDAFIRPEEIDPIYFDGRMYLLAPDGEGAAEPYAVLAAALRNNGRYGIGQVVFSGKDQLALVRPYEDMLQMALLNYAAEILDPAKLHLKLPSVTGAHRSVKMAEQLIENWEEEHFRYNRYVDRHLERVRELVRAKMKGRKIVKPKEEEEPELINLMEALEKSLSSKGRGGHGHHSGTAGKARGHAAHHDKKSRGSTRRRAS